MINSNSHKYYDNKNQKLRNQTTENRNRNRNKEIIKTTEIEPERKTNSVTKRNNNVKKKNMKKTHTETLSRVHDVPDVPDMPDMPDAPDKPVEREHEREREREREVPTTYSNIENIDQSDTHKAKLESEREKRECQKKIMAMKNHIASLKRRQENMNKKLMSFKIKENKANEAKKQKEDIKKSLYDTSVIKRTELEEKRKNIENQRNATNKRQNESFQREKMEEIINYKKYIREKEQESKQNKINKVKAIHDQIIKIKSIRETNKTSATNRKRELNKNYGTENEKIYENNIEETKLLKEQIKQLQLEEDALLNKLNNTRNKYDTYSSNDPYSVGYKNKSKNESTHSHKRSKRTSSFDDY